MRKEKNMQKNIIKKKKIRKTKIRNKYIEIMKLMRINDLNIYLLYIIYGNRRKTSR